VHNRSCCPHCAGELEQFLFGKIGQAQRWMSQSDRYEISLLSDSINYTDKRLDEYFCYNHVANGCCVLRTKELSCVYPF
jgi:hypothetical protein